MNAAFVMTSFSFLCGQTTFRERSLLFAGFSSTGPSDGRTGRREGQDDVALSRILILVPTLVLWLLPSASALARNVRR